MRCSETGNKNSLWIIKRLALSPSIKLFFSICYNPGVKFVTTQNVVVMNVLY